MLCYFHWFRHMCMVMRGVQKVQSKTITSTMLGSLRQDSKSRDEFLNLILRSWMWYSVQRVTVCVTRRGLRSRHVILLEELSLGSRKCWTCSLTVVHYFHQKAFLVYFVFALDRIACSSSYKESIGLYFIVLSELDFTNHVQVFFNCFLDMFHSNVQACLKLETLL